MTAPFKIDADLQRILTWDAKVLGYIRTKLYEKAENRAFTRFELEGYVMRLECHCTWATDYVPLFYYLIVGRESDIDGVGRVGSSYPRCIIARRWRFSSSWLRRNSTRRHRSRIRIAHGYSSQRNTLTIKWVTRGGEGAARQGV